MITAPYTVILEADTQPPNLAGLISGSDKKQIVLIGFCHIHIPIFSCIDAYYIVKLSGI